MEKLKIKDFSLEHTLDSGQFFLYEKLEDYYLITQRNKVFKVKQEKNLLFYQGIEKKDLIHFFNLDLDLNQITIAFKDDQYILLALEKYWGLRLINQDLWQCIIGFVCSSASNIPKIKNNLRLISKYFTNNNTFPSPGEIDNLEKLKEAKTGYRAKYIFQINEMVKINSKMLDEIKNSNYKEAKELLMKFPGVGSKVADCICLFSLGHQEAFPIDTWVKQIIEKLYLKRKAKNLREIEEYIKDNFKGHKGLAQQYLFHYARLNGF